MNQKPRRGSRLKPNDKLSRGLVCDYLFNEGCGTTVFDQSLNGNHGAITNMAVPPTSVSGWGPGSDGVGLRFDGVNDYIDITTFNNLPSGNEDYSYEVDVYISVAKDHNMIFSVGNGADNELTQLTTGVGGDLWLVNFGAGNDWDTGIILSPGVWYHVVLTWDGATDKLYIDGNYVANRALPGGHAVNLQKFEIGHCLYHAIAVRHFNGQINMFGVYNRALSAVEPMMLHKNPY